MSVVAEEIIRGVSKVASLPQIFLKVEEVLEDPNSGAMDLARVIEEDPGLTARLEALEQAYRDDDAKRLADLAHDLKGAGGSFGYPRLSELGLRLEEAAIQGRMTLAAAPLLSIRELLRQICDPGG